MDKNKYDGILLMITLILFVIWVLSGDLTCLVAVSHSFYIFIHRDQWDINKESFEFYTATLLVHLLAYIFSVVVNQSGFPIWVAYFIIVNVIIVQKNISFNKYLMIGSSTVTIVWILLSVFLKTNFPYYEFILIEYLMAQLNDVCAR